MTLALFHQWTTLSLADLLALLPIGFLALGGISALILELMMPKSPARSVRWNSLKRALASVFCLGSAVSAWILVWQGDAPRWLLSHAICVGAYAHVGVFIFAMLGLSVVWMGSSLHEEVEGKSEILSLIFFGLVGMGIVAMSADFVTLFVAIELMTLCIYVLVSSKQTSPIFVEGSLKYFVLGAIASAFLLMGIACVYGGVGTTSWYLMQNMTSVPYPAVFLVGVIFLAVGFLFKLGLVPFHMYIPDAYQAAPSPITAYMAVGVKVAIVMAGIPLLRLLAHFDLNLVLALVVPFVVLTVVGANVMALKQQNVKRMLAYSSIAHGGYLAIGLLVATSQTSVLAYHAVQAVMVYLCAYGLATVGIFALLCQIETHLGQDQLTFDHFRGLAEHHPWISAQLLVLFISLSGLPVSAGFVGKYLLFASAVSAGQTVLVVVSVLASLVSLYYYFRVPFEAFLMSPTPEGGIRMRPSTGIPTLLASACTVLTLMLGLLPTSWVEWVSAIVREVIAI